MAECVKGTKVNTPAVDALLEARRRRQLKKQENLERLTTGDFSVWQMSKTLGPRQARKIGKKMGYIQARGEGPVKSIFLGISENYKARARAQENREHRYMLANLQAKYSLEKQRRKRWIEALRMKQEGKIEDADVIELSYTVRPQSGKDDPLRLINPTTRNSRSTLIVAYHRCIPTLLISAPPSDRQTSLWSSSTSPPSVTHATAV